MGAPTKLATANGGSTAVAGLRHEAEPRWCHRYDEESPFRTNPPCSLFFTITIYTF
jgi:hypothetical protein